jgi:hypothetical protein
MHDDPIVEEVRESGAKLAEQAGYDFHAFCELIRKYSKEQGINTITKEELQKRDAFRLK